MKTTLRFSLLASTSNFRAGSKNNRGGRDKPGDDRGERAGAQTDQHPV